MSCPDCFKGAVHDHGAEPQGTLQTMHGYPCYVASAPSSSSSSSTIIYLCDFFGLNLINNKLLCDRYAAETGFRVIAPDIIPGGPGPVSMLADVEVVFSKKVAWWDLRGQLRRIATIFRILRVAPRLWTSASPPKGFPPSLKFARAVRSELPTGAKLGVAGFCWGGYSSTNLCKETAVEGGEERLIDAQFCAHPSMLSTPDMVVDAVKTLRTPFSMAIGDRDFVYKANKVLETEAALREQVGPPEENDYEIRMYKGCRHGFAVRAFLGDMGEMAAQSEAIKQAVNWFKRYL